MFRSSFLFLGKCLFLFIVASAAAVAQPHPLNYNARVLEPLQGYLSSYASGVSGNIVVGASYNSTSYLIPTMWVDGVPQRLQFGAPQRWALATGIGGGRIAGDGYIVLGPENINVGLLWAPGLGAGAAKMLPIYGEGHSNALGISSDGGTLIGYSSFREDEGMVHATLWNRFGRFDLGSLANIQNAPNRHSIAYGVNEDATIVVGQSQIDTSGALGRAFIWTEAEGMRELQHYAKEIPNAYSRYLVSVAYGATGSNLIVGQSGNTDGNDMWAVAWLGPNHKVTPLSFLGVAFSANQDGWIVGYQSLPNIGSHAMIWRVGTSHNVESFDLNDTNIDWVGQTPLPLSLINAKAIAADGSIAANAGFYNRYHTYIGRGVWLVKTNQ